MHQPPNPGDEVRYRAQSWSVVKVASGRVELRRGGGYTPYQYATAHHRDLHFERSASSWTRRRDEQVFDADAFVRRVVDEAKRKAEKERATEQQERITFAHESGHAVVGHVLGMKITGIVTDPGMLRDLNARGATLSEYYEDEVSTEDVVVKLLAGGAAARMLCPDIPDADRGCGDDERQAREALGGPIPDALRRRADALVAEHRGAIERVVEALAAYDGPYMIGVDVVDAIEAGRVPAARSAEPRELVPAQREDRGHTGYPMSTWTDGDRHGHWAGRSTPCPAGCDQRDAYTSAPPPARLRRLIDSTRSAERAGGAIRFTLGPVRITPGRAA